MEIDRAQRFTVTFVEQHEITRFQDAISEHIGLQFDDTKVDFLANVLQRRSASSKQSIAAYLDGLERSTDSGDEIWALGDELTVAETYFFRNADQFRALVNHVLPELKTKRSQSRTLRLLSAGCASGEEAYSTAILLRDALDETWKVSIVAADISPAILEKARQGHFSRWSLRETPTDIAERWFRRVGSTFVIDESIRNAVTFQLHNLGDENCTLWQPGLFDVVFCRNMLMYFAPARARMIVSRIARSLSPDGYLFLGHAETLRGISPDFGLCHTDDTFYYQRKPHLADPPSSRDQPRNLEDPAISLAMSNAATWVDAIRVASERVHDLTRRPAETSLGKAEHVKSAGQVSADLRSHSDSRSEAVSPRWSLDVPMELLRNERIADALDVVEELPDEAAGDTDVLLLQGVLLTQRGLFDNAEKTCRRLLALDELNAGAHYLLALCREGTGDLDDAIEEDRTATYLDAGFAMPQLHLGLIASRLGRKNEARIALDKAVSLLESEDPSRVLLFGGGFTRETLIGLCRSRSELAGARS